MFGVNSFDILRADTLFTQPKGLLFKADESEQPDEYGQVVDNVGDYVDAGANKECPPCMEAVKKEVVDADGNTVGKWICVPACDTASGEVCYVHPCLSGGWTCLSPQPVGGGGSRIVFPSNLTTTCGEQGHTGNGKACPCVVCNNAVSIANCRDDCRTCSQVQGATNTGKAANNRQLCGSSLGNVTITGAGQGQGVMPTPPSGTTWGFISTPDVCQCPGGEQKVSAPEICPTCEKCANVGCTDPKADNYDPNATIPCGEGTTWPNRCCVYPPYVPSCDLEVNTETCNKHFTNGANMDCMYLGDNCEPICEDPDALDFAGYRASASAKALKELYYYEESPSYDWSQSGKPLGDKESWMTMISKIGDKDTDSNNDGTKDWQERQALQDRAISLFYSRCECPEGEVWSEQYQMCATPGCTNTRACNWNPSARVDDGSCRYDTCTGCKMWSSKHYDPDAKHACRNDAGKQTCCVHTDNSPIPYSCTYDDFCKWNPAYCTGELTGCIKGYKKEGGMCVRCKGDDDSLECKEGCTKEEGRKFYGSALINGLSRYKVGGMSLLTWGVIGLVAGGAYAATQG